MATVTAFIRVSTKKTNEVNIRFRLRDGRTLQLFHKSEIPVKPSDWDSTTQAIKAKVIYDNQKRADFNKSVNNRKALIIDIYNAQSIKDNLTSDWLEDAIDRKINPSKYKLEEPEKEELLKVIQFIDNFVSTAHLRKDKQTGRYLSPNTKKQYVTTANHLKRFAKLTKKEDFKFSDINQKFYSNFVEYLQKEIQKVDDNGIPLFNEDKTPKLLKKSFTQNSVGKYIRALKVMLNEATRVGVNSGIAYNEFHVFNEDVDNIYLDENELTILKDADLKNIPYLDRARDWFLLLAWTGCRFSDLEKIARTDIKDGFITFRQQKTNTKVTIPLHPVVLEVLEKYNYSMPNSITNQKFNDYIKEVAKAAEIDSPEVITKTIGGVLKSTTFPKYKLITSHTGRRSFCTNMYKRGLPTLMIMSISGHKTEKSFLKYIKVRQEEHAAMMAAKWKEIYK
ncbi:MAG: phage integrase SAM-like domain-containing protein [Paludibacteraceae bacterium]|nr:phage integrase SAM-like domain-containing protein [Paludibacteraceae bacterium]MBN2787913.1 phage integrase SAM-like domain-containing protein [Paludibacteraceae bacterium]